MLRSHVWAILGALLVVAGSVGSVIAANVVVRNATQTSHRAFVTSSNEIAATLHLTIQHEQDLAVSFSAFVIGNPTASEAQFQQWTSVVRAFERYPELEGLGETVLVPASQLNAFAAHAVANPSDPSAAGGTFQVSPAGARPYYCFTTLSQARSGQPITSSGLDVCDSAVGPALMASRDSGLGSYVPYGTGKSTVLAVGTPIYQGGVVPTTVQARRDAFIGWVGTEILPGVVLATALQGHAATAVAFHYGTRSSKTTFKAGSAPSGGQTVAINLHNGWTVQTFGSGGGEGLLGNRSALATLIAGITLSLLLGALIYLLGTGRARAMVLVRERTGQLQFQALHDSLTGLPNRALILDRIEQMLARSRRNHLPGAAMFLDLDNFKDINDAMGHPAGDQLLVGVGARLAAALREGDTVGRLGGDEFVVLVEGDSLAGGVEAVADRIFDVLQPPFEIAESNTPLSISGSIGVATGNRLTPEELLRDADIALYRAKAAGKQCWVVFEPSMQDAVQLHRQLEVDLHGALEADQFFLVYQPTVDLQTNAFTGVEALLRWQHPERGVVQPDDFIPALEASGLIVPVGAWVLHEACRQGAIWHDRGHRFSVSVNVSAKQLERPRIVDDVRSSLSASGFDPAMLILELTETTLMKDVDETIARLGLLKALGVRLAVDDFGTGYSSLAYLRQFPIDVLKIDRSFVSGIARSAESAALVHTLVQLGKTLDLETIAEGVEDDDQRIRLQAESVDTGQGYLFSRPLDVTAVDRFLETTSASSGGPTQDDAPASDEPPHQKSAEHQLR